MDFQKKDWQFRDVISESELNRMEDGIEEGITKAEQAQDDLAAHTAATTGVHGATSAATPNTIVQRDPDGRFKAAAPAASDDVARKAEIDVAMAAAQAAQNTANAALPASQYTASDILTKLKTVDGAGSGLDADLLDGMQSSRFVFGDNDRGSTTYAGNLDDVDRSGFYYGFSGHTNSPTGSNGQFIHVQRGDAQALQIYQPFNSDELYFRKKNNSWGSWQKLVKKSELDAHIGSGGSAHAVATTSQAGFMSASDKSKLDGIEAGAQVNTVTSVAGKTGAVTLSKSDVGLGNVQNYGIASQAQAQAGTANNVYMTPLRTKEAIDQFVPIETGTFTPQMLFNGSQAGITYSYRGGRYTRIGNTVHFSLDIRVSSKGSAFGSAAIGGLPFAPSAGSANSCFAVGYASSLSLPSGATWASAFALTGGSIQLMASGNVVDPEYLTSTHFGNSFVIRVSGFYHI